jgi:hypothetical protein
MNARDRKIGGDTHRERQHHSVFQNLVDDIEREA